jgi:hypothetical protein
MLLVLDLVVIKDAYDGFLLSRTSLYQISSLYTNILNTRSHKAVLETKSAEGIKPLGIPSQSFGIRSVYDTTTIVYSEE